MNKCNIIPFELMKLSSCFFNHMNMSAKFYLESFVVIWLIYNVKVNYLLHPKSKSMFSSI